MPIYFSAIAPTCPTSRDQAPADTPRTRRRTSLPKATDLPSAINTANIARSIVTSLVVDRVRTNVDTSKGPSQPKPTKSRWVEDKSKRILRRYKYYVQDEFTREVFAEAWIETERVERMVWVDRGWNVTMTWIYGDKGEGQPVSRRNPDGTQNEGYYGAQPADGTSPPVMPPPIPPE